MATILRDLQITSTDLVDSPANPDARIQLFKRKGEESSQETLLQKAISALSAVFGKNAVDDVEKEATTFNEQAEREKAHKVCSQIWSIGYTLQDSLCSIIHDGDLNKKERRNMMFESLGQFTAAMQAAIPTWAGMKLTSTEDVSKSEAEQAIFNGLIAKYAQTQENPPPSEETKSADIKKSAKKEEIYTMNIDKSKLTPEELAALEAIEKKYGTAVPGDNPPAEGDNVTKGTEVSLPTPAQGTNTNVTSPVGDLHPEVKKALEANQTLATQVEELRKSLEIKDLTIAAKKYEAIGKSAEELAPKLYELKKAGGTVYDEFVALLDEQVTLVEKSGLFGEIGSSRGGIIGNTSELAAKAAEIRKNNSGMTEAEALAKAFEENPEIAAKYEQEYLKGRAV